MAKLIPRYTAYELERLTEAIYPEERRHNSPTNLGTAKVSGIGSIRGSCRSSTTGRDQADPAGSVAQVGVTWWRCFDFWVRLNFKGNSKNNPEIKDFKPMPSGGARSGAGRPKGSKNGKSRTITRADVIEMAVARGLSPLEYMLIVMRDEKAPAARRDWAAEKAAMYCHPRLAMVATQTRPATVNNNHPDRTRLAARAMIFPAR